MTEEEYLESADKCPYCKSDALKVYEQIDENTRLTKYVKCLDCKKELLEHYTLTGITLEDELDTGQE